MGGVGVGASIIFIMAGASYKILKIEKKLKNCKKIVKITKPPQLLSLY
jgi:hypothetical protein